MTCLNLSNLNKICIKQQEFLTKSYAVSTGEVLTDWTCRVQIRDPSGNFLILDRLVITTNVENTQFILNLSPTDTDLDVGVYVLAAELTNSVTGQTGEIVEVLEVQRQWVF